MAKRAAARKPAKKAAAGKSRKRDYHVMPRAEGGWSVKLEGASRASVNLETKAAALTRGREMAKRLRVELVDHAKGGRIRDSDSYGNDPRSRRDKKH